MVGRLDAAFKYSKNIRLAHIYQKEKESITVNIVPDDGYSYENDEKPIMEELRKRLGDQIDIHTTVFQGAWPGNTTICKMILDLNKVFLYANSQGKVCDDVQRKAFYVVDGISIGEHNGPMEPSTVSGGIIAAGTNAFHTDIELLKRISIDPLKIPLYSVATENAG